MFICLGPYAAHWPPWYLEPSTLNIQTATHLIALNFWKTRKHSSALSVLQNAHLMYTARQVTKKRADLKAVAPFCVVSLYRSALFCHTMPSLHNKLITWYHCTLCAAGRESLQEEAQVVFLYLHCLRSVFNNVSLSDDSFNSWEDRLTNICGVLLIKCRQYAVDSEQYYTVRLQTRPQDISEFSK